MVSRQETARQLLTPGEVMQLPPDDEIVLVSGCPPIRAKKARYYEDAELKRRILAPPPALRFGARGAGARKDEAGEEAETHDWVGRVVVAPRSSAVVNDDGGIRQEPGPEQPDEIAPVPMVAPNEFEVLDEDSDDTVQPLAVLQSRVRVVARQAALDPADDLGM
jgi:type IV secretion system protein VirD4